MDICSRTTARFGGSDDEKKAQNTYENALKNMGIKTFSSSFSVRPHEQYGWIYFTSTFTLLAHILFFFAPAFAIASLAVGLIPFVLAMLNVSLLSPLFNKYSSHNMWAESQPTQAVKARLILTLHSDNDFVRPWQKRGGKPLDIAVVVIAVLANLLMLALCIVTCAILGGVGVVSGALLYVGLGLLALVPFEICLYFYVDYNKVNKDLGNLNASDIALNCLEKITAEPLQNLQVIAVWLGSKECNLRGAKEFLKNNDFGKETSTYCIDLDSINSTNINISCQELPLVEKPSQRLADLVAKSCAQNNLTPTTTNKLLSSTQSSIFRQHGYDSINLTSNTVAELSDDDITQLAHMLESVARTMDNNLSLAK